MRSNWVALTTAALVLGCGELSTEPADPFVERAIPEELRESVAGVAAANNAFTFDLYRELAKDADGNLFFSPFSIQTALGMTLAGAAGATETEMTRTLRHTLDRTALHPAFGAMLASLDRGSRLPGYTLGAANRLWSQEGMELTEDFRGIAAGDYGAPPQHADFAHDPESARTRINAWAKEETRGRIQDLFPPGSITDLTRLVLANAIYFKGAWQSQFDPDQTRPLGFWVTPERAEPVPTMFRKLDASIAVVSGASVLSLPYSGGDISMVFLLPDDRDGLDALAGGLDAATLEAWMGALTTHKDHEVYIPRFRITWDETLNDVLKALGMPSAFDPDAADFSRMTGSRGLAIQTVVHKAFVEVNEEGTEAAAATGVGVGTTSVPPAFRADHPFLFLIFDHVTGAVLFAGRVVDPVS